MVVDQSQQGFPAQWQVVELVLEDDSGMIQTVFQQLVALSQLFWGERNLCQVILASVRIVDGTV